MAFSSLPPPPRRCQVLRGSAQARNGPASAGQFQRRRAWRGRCVGLDGRGERAQGVPRRGVERKSRTRARGLGPPLRGLAARVRARRPVRLAARLGQIALGRRASVAAALAANRRGRDEGVDEPAAVGGQKVGVALCLDDAREDVGADRLERRPGLGRPHVDLDPGEVVDRQARRVELLAVQAQAVEEPGGAQREEQDGQADLAGALLDVAHLADRMGGLVDVVQQQPAARGPHHQGGTGRQRLVAAAEAALRALDAHGLVGPAVGGGDVGARAPGRQRAGGDGFSPRGGTMRANASSPSVRSCGTASASSRARRSISSSAST